MPSSAQSSSLSWEGGGAPCDNFTCVQLGGTSLCALEPSDFSPSFCHLLASPPPLLRFLLLRSLPPSASSPLLPPFPQSPSPLGVQSSPLPPSRPLTFLFPSRFPLPPLTCLCFRSAREASVCKTVRGKCSSAFKPRGAPSRGRAKPVHSSLSYAATRASIATHIVQRTCLARGEAPKAFRPSPPDHRLLHVDLRRDDCTSV